MLAVHQPAHDAMPSTSRLLFPREQIPLAAAFEKNLPLESGGRVSGSLSSKRSNTVLSRPSCVFSLNSLFEKNQGRNTASTACESSDPGTAVILRRLARICLTPNSPNIRIRQLSASAAIEK